MIVDVAVFLIGAGLVLAIMLSAIRTVVLPTRSSLRLTRSIFDGGRMLVRAYGRLDKSPTRRHAAMQHSVALGLLSLPLIWLATAVAGFTLMFKGLGTGTWRESYEFAGSSMFTLGFVREEDLPRMTLGFLGSALAISILALLLVTYLPTIYSAYTAREARLTTFETIAGDPPNVVGMIIRLHRIESFQRLSTVWIGWREWFGELRESHTALPAIAFLGASRADRSWVATIGTFLDGAATSLAVLDLPPDPDAALAIRSGSLALGDIAEYFGIEVDRNPSPTDPISVPRERFDQDYDQLVAAGLVVVDRDEAWRNWSGWRVNYDSALVGLAELIASPGVRLVDGATYE